MATILIVDDARSTLRALEVILKREGYTVLTAASGTEGLTYIEQHEVDLLLCDVKMPKMDGLTVLRQVKAQDAGMAVVMMSGHGDISTAVSAMKEGAFDYLVKPFGEDEVLRVVQKALAMRGSGGRESAPETPGPRPVCAGARDWLKSDLEPRLPDGPAGGPVPGHSLAHRRKRYGEGTHCWTVASSQSTGRAPLYCAERRGHARHTPGGRTFGYEKGAFTGALQRKPGHFELADGGTLFLDEIGDMPFEVQAKLLRVLQDGTFKRLGGINTLRVNVRVVAATNKDLSKEVASERFRQDLYYRLNVIAIHLPPLRERLQDIPVSSAFLAKVCTGKPQRDHGYSAGSDRALDAVRLARQRA